MTGTDVLRFDHRIERKLMPIARIALLNVVVTLTVVCAASALAQNGNASRGVVFVDRPARDPLLMAAHVEVVPA